MASAISTLSSAEPGARLVSLGNRDARATDDRATDDRATSARIDRSRVELPTALASRELRPPIARTPRAWR